MEKNTFKSLVLRKVILWGLLCLVFASPSFAQKKTIPRKVTQKRGVQHRTKKNVTQKIDYVIFLKNDSLAQSGENNNIIKLFKKCPQRQQEEILAFMVRAITDSLNADKKESAMATIDNYRLIASPDDEYLGSLIVTQGKYYYDKMDADKLAELHNYVNDISAKSKLDYSPEIAEIDNLYDGVLHGCDDMIGTWLMYNTDKKYGFLYPEEIIKISKDSHNQISVVFKNCAIAGMVEGTQEGSVGGSIGSLMMKTVQIIPEGISDTCYLVSPRELFYFFSSENMKKGKEALASGLRGTVRGAGNSVVGHLARSSNFSSQLLGCFGVIGAESIFSSFIDAIAVSRKTWKLCEGYVTLKDKSQMDVRHIYLTYKMTSESTSLPEPKVTDVNSTLYRYPDGCDIAFIDEYSNLITDHILDRKERKEYFAKHPEAKKAAKSKKRRQEYNALQWEKLKEYNRNH